MEAVKLANGVREAETSFTQNHPKSHLLSPAFDLWSVGGLSLVLFGLFFILKDKGDQTFSLGWTSFYLGTLVNWPHFAASYQLLYGNYKTEFKKLRFIWSAAVVPVLLLVCLYVVFTLQSRSAMMIAIQTMYFFVGWHYIKQTFGIALLFAHQRGYRLDKLYKAALKVNLFCLWIVNWVLLNTYSTEFELFGFKYNQLGFSESLRWPCHIAFGLTTAFLVFCVFKTYVQKGQWPPLTAIVTWLAMTIWYIPALYHPGFFIFIPFFHSLQYLLCVASYRISKVDGVAQNFEDPPRRRLAKIKSHALFFSSAILLGAAGFLWLPGYLDQSTGLTYMGQGQFFMLAFTLFINIHHYFIDHVIWKKDFADLQLRLNYETKRDVHG